MQNPESAETILKLLYIFHILVISKKISEYRWLFYHQSLDQCKGELFYVLLFSSGTLQSNTMVAEKKVLFGFSEVDPAVGIWCFLAAVRVSVRRILRKAEVAFAVQPGTLSAQ